MPYIGTQPKDVRSFGKVQFDFTATQGQTAFTGADDDGKTLGFTEGQIQVYVNGILMDASDYTTSNTNTVTLVSAANLNDIITVVALQTDIPNSDYVPISGGTFSGDMNFSGDLTVGATSIHVDRTNNRLGVGTSSPSGVLSLKKSTRTLDVKLEDTPASGEYGVQFTAGSGDYLGFGAGGSGTAIAIDSSNRVTMSYQPRAWMSKTNGSQSHTTGSTVKVTFDTSTTTNGMSFSNADDRLTVPVAGNYLITAQASTSVTDVYQGDGVYMHIRKNGSNIWYNYSVPLFSTGSAVGEEASISDSYVVPLSANDYIELWLTDINSGNNDFRISSARLTVYLLG